VDGPEPWRTLAERLREAHRRVARADLDAAARRDLTRRLLALTDAAKHDAASASRRLDAFLGRLHEATDGGAETGRPGDGHDPGDATEPDSPRR
jgi:hypothetical protein